MEERRAYIVTAQVRREVHSTLFCSEIIMTKVTFSLFQFLVLLLEAFDAFCIVVKAFLPCFQSIKFPSFNILFLSGESSERQRDLFKGTVRTDQNGLRPLTLDVPPWYGNLQSAICFICLFFSGILTGVQSYKRFMQKLLQCRNSLECSLYQSSRILSVILSFCCLAIF